MAHTEPVFHFPVKTPIANAKLKLIPFLPKVHSAAFIAQTQDRPDLFAHVASGPFTLEQLNADFTISTDSLLSLANPNSFTFAIIDKTRPGSAEDPDGELAGMASFINTSPVNLSTEIGMIIILPQYQRTHVTTHMVGLLLNYALAAKEDGGMGLARMHWHCSAANEASVRVAERMGYEKVGVIPYHFRFPKGKLLGKVGNGRALPPGSDQDDLWRDTMVLSLSWEVWERESKDKVKRAMDR